MFSGIFIRSQTFPIFIILYVQAFPDNFCSALHFRTTYYSVRQAHLQQIFAYGISWNLLQYPWKVHAVWDSCNKRHWAVTVAKETAGRCHVCTLLSRQIGRNFRYIYRQILHQAPSVTRLGGGLLEFFACLLGCNNSCQHTDIAIVKVYILWVLIFTP